MRFSERVMRLKRSLDQLLVGACVVSFLWVLARTIRHFITDFPVGTSFAVQFGASLYRFCELYTNGGIYQLACTAVMYLQVWFLAREMFVWHLRRNEIDCHLVRALPVEEKF